MAEYKDENRCRSCGGKCCEIYKPDCKGGAFNTDYLFENWCEGFFQDCDIDVEPCFDPIIVHLTGNEHLRQELLVKRIDPNYCQYHDPKTGCRISWDRRPNQCKEYRCKEWIAEQLLQELSAKGIDPYNCQHYDFKTGCKLPWDKLPEPCQDYRFSHIIKECVPVNDSLHKVVSCEDYNRIASIDDMCCVNKTQKCTNCENCLPF